MNKLQVEIGRSQHTRKARRVEQILAKKEGVSNVAVSASGILRVEWDSSLTNQSDIIKSIKKLGLSIVNVKIENDHTQKEDSHHGHSYLDILGENTELYFAVISGIFWVLGVVFSFTSGASETIATSLFIIGAIFGGVFTFITAGKD